MFNGEETVNVLHHTRTRQKADAFIRTATRRLYGSEASTGKKIRKGGHRQKHTRRFCLSARRFEECIRYFTRINLPCLWSFPGTFATTMDFMLLPMPPRLVPLEVNIPPFLEAWLAVQEVFTRLDLNEEWDKVKEADVQSAENVLLSAIDGTGTKCNKLLWDCPRRLCPSQHLCPTLCISSTTSSETTCCIKRGSHLRYQNDRKRRKGGSMQWIWAHFSVYDWKERFWPWKNRCMDISILVLVFLLQTCLGQQWSLRTTRVVGKSLISGVYITPRSLWWAVHGCYKGDNSESGELSAWEIHG